MQLWDAAALGAAVARSHGDCLDTIKVWESVRAATGFPSSRTAVWATAAPGALRRRTPRACRAAATDRGDSALVAALRRGRCELVPQLTGFIGSGLGQG